VSLALRIHKTLQTHAISPDERVQEIGSNRQLAPPRAAAFALSDIYMEKPHENR
jgi:hypothetical protein